MTHPLSKAAVEAGAKAGFAHDWPSQDWETASDSRKEAYRLTANLNISAAFGQSRIEGSARDGFGRWSDAGTIMQNTQKYAESEIPLVIIRKATP